MRAAGYELLHNHYRYDLMLDEVIRYGAWNGLAKTPKQSAERAPLHEVLSFLDMQNFSRQCEANYLKE